MLVDSKKLKALRGSRNWTQQHLAEVCDLSMRTIQRVEKDGVASNETVAAYATTFQLDAAELLISTDQFEQRGRKITMPPLLVGILVLSSFVAGARFAAWFL